MRRLLIALTGAALSLAPSQASAQEISARDASIRIGGRLHSQYSASSVEAAESDFFFRRVRLIADISVTDFFSARVQPDFAGGETQLQDAYVRFNFSDGFRVSMGQFKRAFDLFELSSSTDLSIIERDGRVEGVSGCAGVSGACSYSRLTEKLAFAGRDQGVKVEISGGSVSFQGTVTNGTGINTSDENDAKSYSGRLSFGVSDDVTVSGQVGVHDYLDPNEETAYAPAFGADVEFGGWRDGLHVQAAVATGDNWRVLDASDEPVSFTTYQGVVSYYAPIDNPRFAGVEPLVRLSFADPNGDGADDGAVIFTPGLMLYVQGKNKIGFNVDVFSPQTGDTEYSFKLQAFLYF
jgi:hypothetical protein